MRKRIISKRNAKKISEIIIAVMLLTGCAVHGSREMADQTEQSNVDEPVQDCEEAILDESPSAGKDSQTEGSSQAGEGSRNEGSSQAREGLQTMEEGASNETSGKRQPDMIAAEEMQNRLDENRIIEEQSFQVELNDWGEVRFVSYRPDYASSANSLEDVSFYLLKNEEIFYQFPYIDSDHTSGYGAWSNVKFVMFMDTDDDGKSDIVIGPEYCTGAGPQGAIPHTVVRIYEDRGDSFTYNKELSEKINDYLPWESNVQAKDVKRLLQLINGKGSLTDYESYTGKWSEGAGYLAAYEDLKTGSRNELICTIRNGNEFSGSLFTEQDITERFASVEEITGVIIDGELFYEFTDDGWGGTGTLHIMFQPNQINVEVLNYQMAENNASGYGISGCYEMTIRK